MNYATVINGPFSSNANPRLGCTPNTYAQQVEIVGQYSQMMQKQSVEGATGHAMNVYNPFLPSSLMKDSRVNIHVGSKLFVGQVPAMTTEEQLRPVFEPYGELLEVKIMRDSLGRSKGSAWVRYETNEMAMKAINALHEKHTVPPQTNPLRVQFAIPNNGRQYQQHQQQQQQTRNSVELGNPMNQYNIGSSMGGGAQKGRMMMLRSGTSPNTITTSSTSGSGDRYVSSGLGGGGFVETLSMAAGPYTSSANRFHNLSALGNRRDVYSSFDQTQITAPQSYLQQRGAFPSPITSPPSMCNQPPPSQVPANRSGNNVKGNDGVNVESFERYDTSSNNNVTSLMSKD